MRKFFCAAGFALLSAHAMPAQLVAPELLKPENRTVSTSKQFTVFGGTREVRSYLVRRAEQLKESLHEELNLGDGWRAPILLTLTPQDGLRLRQPRLFAQVFDAGEAGRKLQLDLSPGVMGDSQAVDDAILRSLLLEIAVRRQKFEGNRFVEPPGWLVAAMSAAVSGREPGEEARMFSALLETKAMPKLDRFLRQDPASLRGKARDVHEAQSLALYRCLLELPRGRELVTENLTLPEPMEDPVERFAQTWPDLPADPEKLARIWALGIARLSSPSRVEFLSSEETSANLAVVLRALELPAAGEEAVGKLAEDSKSKEGRFRFEKAATDLRNLGFRAHPLYAALVEEYRVLFDSLSRGKRRGLEAKFIETEELRIALDTRRAEITDFLNWYQANAAPEGLQLATKRPKEPASARNDSLTRYLDSVEERGW
ncbi:MAG: hypothetical protein JHD33_03895 [Chthoniobacterales bacterium]|nr:hypothetical protein [Chthoniobacterales bacterium]